MKSLLILILLATSELMAQSVCLELVVKVEDSIRVNDSVSLILITSSDTIPAFQKGKFFCFPDTTRLIGEMDVLVDTKREKFLFQSLYAGFLEIKDNSMWIVGCDRHPFVKEKYPRIRKWKGVEMIEFFEVRHHASEDVIMVYKRRKNGTYIVK